MRKLPLIACLFFMAVSGNSSFAYQTNPEVQQEVGSANNLEFPTGTDIDGRGAELALVRQSGTTDNVSSLRGFDLTLEKNGCWSGGRQMSSY